MSAKVQIDTIQPKADHKATVIIFHGACDNAENFKNSLKDVKKNFRYNNIKIVLPSASPKPYTASAGLEATVWYDREDCHKDARECRSSLKEAHKVVEHLIAEEGKEGISPENIVIGGFSMGGGLALHSGILVNPKLAGIFSIGAFLHHDSMVYEKLERNSKESNAALPKVFMTHCEDDQMIPISWGSEIHNKLKDNGVRVAYHPEPYGGHTVGPSQMDLVDRFVRKCVNCD